MRLLSLTALVVCFLLTARQSAANMFVMPPAHQMGPVRMIDRRRGWEIKYGPHGSVVLRTMDGGRSWEDRTPPGFGRSAPDLNDTDTFTSSFGSRSSFGLNTLGPRRCWIAFGSRVKDEIIVERTADRGQHWRHAAIAGGAASLVLQFLDDRHGFLLALGGPAAGHMSKDFYSTSDGGKTWTKGGSPDWLGTTHVTPIGSYYPSGMAFRNTREGWITGSYHGEPSVPLIQTRDGGRTWAVQEVDLPGPYEDGYANTSQPRFFGRGRQRGAFTAFLVNNSNNSLKRRSVNYLTHDGGKHWYTLPFSRSRKE